MFDEEAKAEFEAIVFTPDSVVVALIGPEGGLERKEVELAREAGLRIGSLGSWVLRAELAGALAPYWVYSRVGG